MTFTVTVSRKAPVRYELTSHSGCDALNPKELLLLSAALCASHTLEYELRRRHVTPQRMELTLSGELSTPTLRPEGHFTSFHVAYNVACNTLEEQERVGEAVRETQERACGLLVMLRKIAPTTSEVAIVSTEERDR